jgi:hypothetical protein
LRSDGNVDEHVHPNNGGYHHKYHYDANEEDVLQMSAIGYHVMRSRKASTPRKIRASEPLLLGTKFAKILDKLKVKRRLKISSSV